jgi:hypothetical protein
LFACTWIEEGFFAALRMTTSHFFRGLFSLLLLNSFRVKVVLVPYKNPQAEACAT